MISLLLAAAVMWADQAPCPKNNFKACDKVLHESYAKDPGKEFVSLFDDVCYRSARFRCTKMQIMGDIPERMGELKTERPGASLFEMHVDGKYIYLFEKRVPAKK